MAQESASAAAEELAFSFDLGEGDDDAGYDPLDGPDQAAGEGEGAAGGAPLQDGPSPAPEERADTRPASERTAELFKRMARQQRLLLAILNHCTAPQTFASIRERVGALQEKHRSIFSLDGVCGQLEGAGALARVFENGEPYVYEDDAEPETEVVDGVECIKPKEPPAVYWLTTDAGRAVLASYDPAAKLAKLLKDDRAYRSIYERVLTMCAQDGGATMPELSKAVDSDPLVQSPRFYAAHFVNNLEACDAVSWEPNWVATEIGREGLEMLANGALDAPDGE